MKIRFPWNWRKHPAGYLATGYAIVGGVWIILSDELLAALHLNLATLTHLSTLKGWVFVLITSLALFAMIRTLLAAVSESETLINQQHNELAAALDQITAADQRLREHYDAVNCGMLVTDVDGLILYVNQAAGQITGIDAVTAVGSSVAAPAWRLRGEDGVPIGTGIVLLQQVLRTGQPIEDIIVGMERGEHTIWLMLSVQPINDETTGRIFELVYSFVDVTERRNISASLAASEARYRELFEKVSEAFALHEVILDDAGQPTDYRYLAVNPAFEILTGLRAQDIIGKTAREVLPGTDPYWIRFYGEVAQTGKPVSLVKYSDDFYRYFAVHAFSPKPGQFAALFRDVTDTRLAEERVKRQNNYLTAMYQTSLVLMSNMDLVELLTKIVCQAEKLVGATSSFVFLIDDRGECAELKVGQGAYKDLIGLKLRPGEGVAGKVWQSGQPMIISDISHWEGRLSTVDYREIEVILCAPLIARGQITGMLGLVHNDPAHVFSDEDTAVVVQFAQLAAIAIENARLYSEAQMEIADRKQVEYRLRLVNEVFRNTDEGVIITEADGTVIWVNKAFSDISGYPENEVIGGNWKNIDADSRGTVLPDIGQERESAGHWSGECWSRRRDGQEYPAWRTISAIRGNDGEIAHYVIVFTDISEHKRDTDRIEYLASHDLLTELPNRSLLLEYADDALLRAKRRGASIAVMFIDIDYFKVINDAYGHTVGDGAIRMAAVRIGQLVGTEQFLARMGGDEFAIVFSETATPESVGNTAANIIKAFEPQWEISGNVFHLTPSIGIAIYPVDADDAQTLLRHAELAMYRAKERGKNNYQFFEPELNRRALERMTMENSLRQALMRGELTLYYQPKVSVASGQVTGVEALVRWLHPERGMISPAEFIPLAEETGLIIPIGEWVLRTACRQIRQWREQGVRPLSISVNLSARQFERPDFAAKVEDIIREERVEPQALELEITESMAVRDVEYTIRILDRFKTDGISISLDDFGTGYSSFMYLKQFSITTLKIDQSFIRDIAVDNDDAAIVAAIIDLARNLRLRVIAEGVETQVQLDFLRERHCDEMQGFLFSKPVPPEMITAMLKPGE